MTQNCIDALQKRSIVLESRCRCDGQEGRSVIDVIRRKRRDSAFSIGVLFWRRGLNSGGFLTDLRRSEDRAGEECHGHAWHCPISANLRGSSARTKGHSPKTRVSAAKQLPRGSLLLMTRNSCDYYNCRVLGSPVYQVQVVQNIRCRVSGLRWCRVGNVFSADLLRVVQAS
jgi:hypothetical protein